MEEPLNICDFKLTAVNLWKCDIPVSNLHAFFRYAFLFVMKKSMQEGGLLKQVGFFIRCSKLKKPAKSCKFLSSGVILKSPNNIVFVCVEIYGKLLDKLSKNTDLLCSGGLYVPTINHFLKWRFISRKRDWLLSLFFVQI